MMNQAMAPSSRLDELITGRSALSGYAGTSFSLLVTRTTAPVMSVPTANSSTMDEYPSCDSEFISSTPSTDLRYSSCCSTISFSISSGDAPGQIVVTEITGRSISGVSCTGTLRSATKPPTTAISTPTITETGKRMDAVVRLMI